MYRARASGKHHGKAGVKEELGASPCRALASRPSQEAQCSVPDAELAPGGWASRAHSMAPSGVYSPHPQPGPQGFALHHPPASFSALSQTQRDGDIITCILKDNVTWYS